MTTISRGNETTPESAGATRRVEVKRVEGGDRRVCKEKHLSQVLGSKRLHRSSQFVAQFAAWLPPFG